MRIDVYLDGKDYPYTSLTLPEKFQLDTSILSDRQHQLRFLVVEDEQITGERAVRFKVQNGPSIAVRGLLDGDTVNGEISVLANAYSSKIGDDFEPLRIESPVPIPTWAWVLFLSVLAWGPAMCHRNSTTDAAVLPVLFRSLPMPVTLQQARPGRLKLPQAVI
jgi:hypothetical protein